MRKKGGLLEKCRFSLTVFGTITVVCVAVMAWALHPDDGVRLRDMLLLAAGIAVVLATGCAVLMRLMGGHIAKLENLAEYVKQYAWEKDLRILDKMELQSNGTDEISLLGSQIADMIYELEDSARNLAETSRELTETRDHADKMHELANKDALTGIRNKTAYDTEVRKLNWRISTEPLEFGIVMIDLNFLKKINDTFGHEQGNFAIRKLCRTVCGVFGHSPVFRIGGDEFVVVLEGHDYEHVDGLLEDFGKMIRAQADDLRLEPWERISAAIGFARYERGVDENVENVFRRADKEMYACKAAMKAVRA